MCSTDNEAFKTRLVHNVAVVIAALLKCFIAYVLKCIAHLKVKFKFLSNDSLLT